MSKRSLRYASPEDMPHGMRELYRKRPGSNPPAPAASRPAPPPNPPTPAQAPGWVPGGAKRSKYAAKPTEVDGIRFDSKAEGRYYQQLKMRVAAGEVAYFLRQVPIHLPGNTRYVVDFLEVLADGRIRFVDVKGMQTQTFRLKKRQVEALYPIQIEIEK